MRARKNPMANLPVCRCNKVTEQQIRESIRNGAVNLEEISCVTKAATGCGGCQFSVEKILWDELGYGLRHTA